MSESKDKMYEDFLGADVTYKRLTREDKEYAFSLRLDGLTNLEIANIIGVSASAIGAIFRKRKKYKYSKRKRKEYLKKRKELLIEATYRGII